MTPKTPTIEVVETLNGKRALWREWEAQPVDVKVANEEYLRELDESIRRLQIYLDHRKDSPLL